MQTALTTSGTNNTLPGYVSTILASSNSSILPRLSIAVSGGGYRAAHFGAGGLAALDGRNETAITKGALSARTPLILGD